MLTHRYLTPGERAILAQLASEILNLCIILNAEEIVELEELRLEMAAMMAEERGLPG